MLMTRRHERRKWLREAGVYAMLYGIPLVLLFPYTRFRPDAEFRASVRSQAVDFTVGSYHEPGPFIGGCADVSFESLVRVQLPGVLKWRPLSSGVGGGSTDVLWGGIVRFRNVKFHSLLLTKGTQVRVNWYELSPSGVTVNVLYGAILSAPAATVFLDDKSTVEFSSSSFSESGKPNDGKIQGSSEKRGLASLYPRGDLRFPVSLSPCTPSVKPSAPTRPSEPGAHAAVQSPQAPQTPRGLPTADRIPLLPGSGISFLTDDGGSGILGIDNSVQVTNSERKEILLQGQRLEIASLRDRSQKDSSQISLQIRDGIAVSLLGRAGVLEIDGADARPSLAEYLRAQKILSAWLVTSILVGSAALTVASRIKLVKLGEKEG